MWNTVSLQPLLYLLKLRSITVHIQATLFSDLIISMSTQATQSAQSSLPTGWLAPPKGLPPSSHPIKIASAPIAVSATLALVVGAFVIILFCRKNKEVFQEDRDPQTADTERTTTMAHDKEQSRRLVATEMPDIQLPALSSGTPTERQPIFEQAPKLVATLGWDDGHIARPETSYAQEQQPLSHKQYYSPGYESDDETLNDYRRNSVVWEPPRSEVGDVVDKEGWIRYGGEEASYVTDESIRRGSIRLASKTPLGDAY